MADSDWSDDDVDNTCRIGTLAFLSKRARNSPQQAKRRIWFNSSMNGTRFVPLSASGCSWMPVAVPPLEAAIDQSGDTIRRPYAGGGPTPWRPRRLGHSLLNLRQIAHAAGK